jgi:hypothetical protein
MHLAETPANRAVLQWWRLTIPSSVLFSALYAGLHFIIWVFTLVATVTGDWSGSVYATPGFVPTSAAIGVMLLVYLGLDLVRWRGRHPDWQRFGYVTYALAAVLVLLVLVFLARVAALA